MTLPRADAPYTHRTATCWTCGHDFVTVLNHTLRLVPHREQGDISHPMCRDKRTYPVTSGVYDVKQPREA